MLNFEGLKRLPNMRFPPSVIAPTIVKPINESVSHVDAGSSLDKENDETMSDSMMQLTR